jgi:hypothetical protein
MTEKNTDSSRHVAGVVKLHIEDLPVHVELTGVPRGNRGETLFQHLDLAVGEKRIFRDVSFLPLAGHNSNGIAHHARSEDGGLP